MSAHVGFKPKKVWSQPKLAKLKSAHDFCYGI